MLNRQLTRLRNSGKPKEIAKDIGVKLYVIETNELANENFSKNPENRCYYCKKELLQALLDVRKRARVQSGF